MAVACFLRLLSETGLTRRSGCAFVPQSDTEGDTRVSDVDSRPYPMVSGGPYVRFRDAAVLVRKARRRAWRTQLAAVETFSENLKDRVLPFDECPSCEACGCTDAREAVVARDGNRIVECTDCGLWYTSPRIEEARWMAWLATKDAERNVEFTENRLRYGVALDRNVPYSFGFWWRRRRRRLQRLIRRLGRLCSAPLPRLFDIGCGVGHLLKAAQDMGLEVSGNELNAYAVQRMRDLFQMDVHDAPLAPLIAGHVVPAGAYDIVTMTDVIEHVYHPLKELRAARDLLTPDGVVYVATFAVDTACHDRLGAHWGMFMWNHTFHFSSSSLSGLMAQAGLAVMDVRLDQDRGLVGITARRDAMDWS